MLDAIPSTALVVLIRVILPTIISFFWIFFCNKGDTESRQDTLGRNLIGYNVAARLAVPLVVAFPFYIIVLFVLSYFEEGRPFLAASLTVVGSVILLWIGDHYFLRRIFSDRKNIYVSRPLFGAKVYPREQVARVFESGGHLFTIIKFKDGGILCVGDAMRGRNRFINSLGRSMPF